MFSIFKNEELSKRDIINLYILIMISSGIFGFIYETIFYRIDLGYFVKRGSTFGPWIPIYVWGGLFITLLTYRFKNKPLLVLLLAMLISGLLEYFTGMVLFEVFKIRLWDYNTEIWNFGNINGYICLRSILFFGLSGLILIYLMIPSLIKIIKRVNKKAINIVSIILITCFVLDMAIYGIVKML